MSNMGANGGSSARDGANITNVTVRDVYTGTTSGAGIFFESSENSIVSNSTLSNNGGDGIYFGTGGVTPSHNTISGNLVQGNGDSGIVIASADNSTISGNTVEGNTSYGIHLETSTFNTVSGNTASGNLRGIALLVSSHNNQVSSNNIIDNGGATTNNGIYLSASDFNSLVSNVITDSSCTTNCFAIKPLQRFGCQCWHNK
jgi:parallel beta-helix repeat protein